MFFDDSDDNVIPFNDGGNSVNHDGYNKQNYNKGNYNNNSGYNKGQYNNNNGNKQFNKGGYNGGRFKKQEPEEIALYKPYVGAANKDTPSDVQAKFKLIAAELASHDYTVRTGAMHEVDEIFENVDGKKELHLPWRDFNNKESKLTFNSPLALYVAKLFQPNFDTMKPFLQAFLAKNARLILGKDLKSRAMFVITWSEDGAETIIEKTSKTGNVGHLIAIANAMKVPVFNFGKPDAEKRLRAYLNLTSKSMMEI